MIQSGTHEFPNLVVLLFWEIRYTQVLSKWTKERLGFLLRLLTVCVGLVVSYSLEKVTQGYPEEVYTLYMLFVEV